MGSRRKDWIQFAVLVFTILAAYWSLAYEQGKIHAQLDALQRQTDRIEQRLDELTARK